MILALALFLGAFSASQARAAIQGRLDSRRVNPTTVQASVVLSVSQPGVRSFRLRTPMRSIRPGPEVRSSHRTYLQPAAGARTTGRSIPAVTTVRIRWVGNVLRAQVTVRITISGRTATQTRVFTTPIR